MAKNSPIIKKVPTVGAENEQNKTNAKMQLIDALSSNKSARSPVELSLCIFRFIRPLIPVVSAHRFHSYSPGHSSVIRQSLSHTI